MPTDLQIIDGFEGLRAEFASAHPSADKSGTGYQPVSQLNQKHPPEDIFDVWLRVVLNLVEPTSRQRRALRSLARHCVQLHSAQGSPPGGKIPPDDPEVRALLKKFPSLLSETDRMLTRLDQLKSHDGTIRLKEEFQTLAGEAEGWAKAFPRMAGLKAWQLLARLGRSVIPPEASLRRFFWRLGLLEGDQKTRRRDAPRIADCVEKIAGLTGLSNHELTRLLEWHTASGRNGTEGGRCGKNPDCPDCPFHAGCLYFRFRAAQPSEAMKESSAGPNLKELKHRLDSEGAESLADSELLALLLESGDRKRDAIQMACDLITRFDGLKGIDACPVAEFQATKTLSAAKARRIKAGIELGRRLSRQTLQSGDSITSSQDVWLAFRNRYSHIPQEHFISVLLDTKNRVIHSHIVSKGSLTGSLAHPREVFKEAIRRSAGAVILLHNHPSGDPEPSSEDVAITRRLAEAGKLLGIRVLDHIILGGETYYSFKDEGKL